jgi:uncharacterized membrane protein YccC
MSRALANHRVRHWLEQHDRDHVALRRATRTAVVMPSMFAISFKVLDNLNIALYASFGSIALLMLVDFAGPTRNRLEAQAGLSVAGAVLICIATLASKTVWSAALLMAVVAFVVIFIGVVSSVLARATTALLLAFILPASIAAPASGIPDRLAGWGLASGAAFLAVWLLWPAPPRSHLRTGATAACRALATFLSTEAQGPGDQSSPDANLDTPELNAAVTSLERQFLATPWRPTGLSASDRALVRLVDEVTWMHSIVTELSTNARPDELHGYSRAVQLASATVLDEAATLLDMRSAPLDGLATAQGALAAAVEGMEAHLEGHLVLSDTSSERQSAQHPPGDEPVESFLSSLEFSFRSREIGYAATRIATDVEHAVTAERRGFVERVLGHEAGGTTPWASARARIRSHLQRDSVWLHNSIRGAIGLGIAVLVAEETGVQHSFWVILGTLSVLRSNAFSTGQNAVRAIGGTLIGFVVGAALVELVGTNVTLLWFLLPVALLVAGFAPTAVSFAAGQAGFTLTLVILFNILEPAGWRVGLVRVEDVAIGCAVSAGVALLFWPRGASGEFGLAMRNAYVAGVGFLAAAAYGSSGPRSAASATLPGAAERAAAASRRLDDAFRSYVAERGSKPVPLADVTTLVTGVAILRLCADAIVDLWDRPVNDDDSWRVAHERLGTLVDNAVTWYDDFAQRFERGSHSERPSPEPGGSTVLDAVRNELTRAKEPNVAMAVKILWTENQVSIVQRLEPSLESAAHAAESLWGSHQRELRWPSRRVPSATH